MPARMLRLVVYACALLLAGEMCWPSAAQALKLAPQEESNGPSESEEPTDESKSSEPSEFFERSERRESRARDRRMTRHWRFDQRLGIRCYSGAHSRLSAAERVGESGFRNGIGGPLRC